MIATRGIAAVGDVSNPDTWSGIPYHFWQAASHAGFAERPWRVDLSRITWQRYVWNARQMLRGGTGGFQYSDWFLDLLEDQIPGSQMSSEVITFSQHFPRARSIGRAGGTLNHYLDAPFVALASGRGLDLDLPDRAVRAAEQRERENFAASHRIVTMARWAAEVVRAECEVPSSKVFTILPGANLDVPEKWEYPRPNGRAGKDRPFTLGFVGKDWKRKGLPLLISVRNQLARRGWKAQVLIAGTATREIQRADGVEFAGFIDKQEDSTKFLRFLTTCDVGCLFSEREALGISTLEFLRAGVPVAGFAHEGMADTLPPDAGFRFAAGTTANLIADAFEAYLSDEDEQARLRTNAKNWSRLVTWARCIREFQELWETGAVASPVQPWQGLSSGA